MCTLVVSRQPDARCPLLVVAVRDEMLDREWRPPAHHWPGHPNLVGGLDLLAGGTWLAVDPTGVRVGCVLNGRGTPAPEATRRSRGDLPLRAAAEGTLSGVDPTPYDPFHLILAGGGAAAGDGEVLSWDGRAEHRFPLPVGTHFFDNQGYWRPGRPATPRAARFGPAFAAGRPDPAAAGPGAPVEEAWRPWSELLRHGLLPPDDPRALLVRHRLPAGPDDRSHGRPDRVAGSSSITLLATGADLGPAGLRYDFTAHPERPSWHRVTV